MFRVLLAAALSLTMLAAVPPEVYAQKCDPKKQVCPPPPCDPKTQVCDGDVTADCSPGYYKKHPETWQGICCTGTACDLIAQQLCAECGATPTQRAAAKESLDSCFGTAAASPCTDDD
jgi:hypothetical protein